MTNWCASNTVRVSHHEGARGWAQSQMGGGGCGCGQGEWQLCLAPPADGGRSPDWRGCGRCALLADSRAGFVSEAATWQHLGPGEGRRGDLMKVMLGGWT